MFQINLRLCFIHLTFFLLFIIGCIGLGSNIVYAAMSIDAYPYTKIYNALPTKYRSEEYIYQSDDDAGLIAFATYNNNDYRTSIKKQKNNDELLYCIDHNNNIEFTDSYAMNLEYFNNELRTRLGIAFYYGPQTWSDKASSEFTTGNFVLDYYMTQIVTHALIYNYGGARSGQGIDFDKITFKENTGNLQKKTKALYEFCCNAKLEYKDGDFQAIDFAFHELVDHNVYLDGEQFISPTITCKVSENNADVTEFERKIIDDFMDGITVHTSSSAYNSDVQISFSKQFLDKFSPRLYSFSMEETVTFDRKQAALWYCSLIEYKDTTQELGGLMSKLAKAYDCIDLQFLIGKLYLYKTDSITAEVISDAQFEVLQYNASTKKYEFYCNMTYNAKMERFESDNLYLSVNNKEGKFKVVETSPGNNYLLDWNGHYFEVTPDTYIHELYVENQPVLGSLKLQKKGEQWSYEDDKFLKNNKISLPDVKFELYAKEDIYVKDKVMFEKNKKIVDMITDDNGIVEVDNLPMGAYYVKETQTLDGYILDTSATNFTITRDKNRQYSKASISLLNKLHTSQIHIFKCYFDEKDVKKSNPIPLAGVQFGLYLKNDLCDISGNTILEKNTCVSKKVSDANGSVIFDNLPYAEYYIKELDAPEDFIINDGIISVPLEDFQYDETKNMYVCKKNIVNKKQKFNLCVKKAGESFVGAIPKEEAYGQYYTYQIGKTSLKDVTFALYDIDKKLVSTETTDVDGTAVFSDVLPGTYYLSEISAPAEYKLIQVDRDITLKMDSKDYNEFAQPTLEETFFDELCNVTIHLNKEGEQAYVDNETLQYRNVPLENVVFGIYQNFDYLFSDNSQSLPTGSCVGYIVTNSEGVGSYCSKLPSGNYYLKELITNDNYSLDTTKYYFDVTPYDNQDITVRFNENNTVYNKLSKASVQIVKTDADTGKTLKNVEFTLYNNKKEKIGVYKTNKKGKIVIKNLPYGEYYFVETQSRKGYYSSNNKYYFELNSPDMITLNITNSPILKLGYEENYKTALLVTCIVSIAFFLAAFVSYQTAKHKHHEK